MKAGWLALAGLLAAGAWGMIGPADAQSGNLLANASFDGAYVPQGNISGGVPQGWQVWGSFQNSDHESLISLVRSAPYSWRFRTRPGLPTGGGYQTVDVQAGVTYRFAIYALIWTCNDGEWQCRRAEDIWSDESSGAAVRVGIDPYGGSDPTSANIQWSGFISPFLSGHLDGWVDFQGISVDATARSNRLTVFTYYSANATMRFHDVFWDDASLVAVSAPSTGGDAPPPATAVPVVVDPQYNADGAQVHTVQAGQTLSQISRAYDVPLATLRALNGMAPDESLIRVGQRLIVRAAPATSTPIPTMTPILSLTPLPTAIAAAPGSTAAPPGNSSPQATAVAIAGDPGAGAAETGADDDDATRQIVQVLAIVVMGVAAVGIGGVLALGVYLAMRRA